MDLFKDKKGRIVLFQTPNSPLIGWFIFTVLGWFWSANQTKLLTLFGLLSFGFIFTWAWLEITSGVNYFRRILGLVVLVIVVYIRM